MEYIIHIDGNLIEAFTIITAEHGEGIKNQDREKEK
jgi:hypothetical protein